MYNPSCRRQISIINVQNYGGESPRESYPAEEDAFSLISEEEDEDFQRYRDYVMSEEQTDGLNEEQNAAPVYYNEHVLDEENVDAQVNSIDAAHNTRRQVLDGCVNRYHRSFRDNINFDIFRFDIIW